MQSSPKEAQEYMPELIAPECNSNLYLCRKLTVEGSNEKLAMRGEVHMTFEIFFASNGAVIVSGLSLDMDL